MQHGAKTLLSVHPDLVPNSLLNPCSKWNLPSKVVLGFENNLKGLSSALLQTGGCSGKGVYRYKVKGEISGCSYLKDERG